MPLWLLENCFDVGTRRFPRFLALHWCSGASRRSRLPVAFAAFWVGKVKSSYATVASLHFNRYDQTGVKNHSLCSVTSGAMLYNLRSYAL